VRMSFSPVIILALVLCINACTPQSTAVPFIPPQNETSVATAAAQYTPPPQPTALGDTPTSPNSQLLSSPSAPCTNNLHFIQDVSYPDGSIVKAGDRIEKVWRVENNGTCNWDSQYRMRLVNGDQLGAPAELALYPARPGTQADLRIVFIAPAESRLYLSTWQAYDANGLAFGDPFYIDISVQSQ
jgi:Ig-like domain from next to BRCA1 gene